MAVEGKMTLKEQIQVSTGDNEMELSLMDSAVVGEQSEEGKTAISMFMRKSSDICVRGPSFRSNHPD